MRLLRRNKTGEFSLTEDLVDDAALPAYAILSHTWGADAEEVTFDDLTGGTGEDKPGYEKIRFCGERAALDGLEYFWIDTCCINKANKAELSLAINSMFRWYQKAVKCYVYLSDVSTSKRKVSDRDSGPTWERAFQVSKWFTRGWTLQELLAPSAVEFFSREGKLLDSKVSLAQLIHKITGVPKSAIQGTQLSQFTVDERLSWIQHRQTKLEEDKIYSLLGILNVYIAPFYGEGTASAFQRLREEISKLDRCIHDVRITDPYDDKKRIIDTKGGLLGDSYRWVLDHPNFQQWHSDAQSRLLWIKGDPGKGKTMLLCGITDELEKSNSENLCFFFCQGTISNLNNATAVLRGLLYLLVKQQPWLVSYLRQRYDQAGRSIFEANAWIVVSEMFTSMVLDPNLRMTYLVVDALDECIADLPRLLDLIIRTSSSSSRIKWLLSSRNELHIEQKLKSISAQARLSLELKQNAEQVADAVDMYIDKKLACIDSLEDTTLRSQVREVLRQKANGTFLWVALVVQELEKPESWDPLEVVEEVPVGLHQLYNRMVDQIQQLTKKNSETCRLLLSTVSVAYRPLYLAELGSLCKLSGHVSTLTKNTRTLVAMCGSFLTIVDDQVYLIHQSAKDYLGDEARAAVFRHQGEVHYDIFSQSLRLLSGTLKRDIYSLDAVGCLIDEVTTPAPDPLATTRYSCIYWIDHLCDWSSSSLKFDSSVLMSGGLVNSFMRKKYLYWLEALSLCKSISKGVVSMARLEAMTEEEAATMSTMELVRDARRFIMYHKSAIESSPLQVYSALLFSPTHSVIRALFKNEEPQRIAIKSEMQDVWSHCLQTLEGHSTSVNSVAFSHDSTRLASASGDGTVKVWDARSGECLLMLEGHSDPVHSVTFSHDSTRLASASKDGIVKVWDARSSECLLTLKGHSTSVNSVAFSPDSTRLASASEDGTVKVWDTCSGECLLTLEGHSDTVHSVAFSHNSTQLVSASNDRTVKIWDAYSGECVQTLKGHSDWVRSVAFSYDSTRLVSGSHDGTVKVWNACSGECLLTLYGQSHWVTSVAFSHDSTWLASASRDRTIKVWDARTGKCLSTLKGHSHWVTSVAFSQDSTRLASASEDGTVKVWDARSAEYPSTIESHSQWVNSVVFAHDSTRLASGSGDHTVKVWDARSGKCLSTLKGHSNWVRSVTFSHDSTRLASASGDGTVRVWDTCSSECLLTLEGHSDPVHSVAFSHNSTQLVSASNDRTVKIWDAYSGECIQTLKGHSDWVRSVAFSYDSTRLVSGSHDGTVKVWDACSGECLLTLKGHSDPVTSVAFSYDSARLASASGVSGTVKAWDARSKECLWTIEVGKSLYSIWFDSTDNYLHTDIGVVNINALLISASASTSAVPQIAQYEGIALSVAGTWITHGSDNLLWLPSEFRPSCSALSGGVIAIGTGSGRVWICEVQSILQSSIATRVT